MSLHPSFLHRRQVLKGLALTNKFVGSAVTETRTSYVLLAEL